MKLKPFFVVLGIRSSYSARKTQTSLRVEIHLTLIIWDRYIVRLSGLIDKHCKKVTGLDFSVKYIPTHHSHTKRVNTFCKIVSDYMRVCFESVDCISYLCKAFAHVLSLWNFKYFPFSFELPLSVNTKSAKTNRKKWRGGGGIGTFVNS